MTGSGSATASVTIVICTFHREQLLERLLAAFSRLRHPDRLAVDILVVDNSDTGTARSVVDAGRATCPFPLRWIEAHPANISVARNTGVAASQGDWIAFLDDDQEPDAGWLDAVAQAITGQGADAYFGRVEARFETPGLVTPAIRRLFSRNLDAPAGTELFALGPRKTPGIALATNNSVFRTATLSVWPRPFDPDFGLGGGEDYDLICRMQARGSRLAWMPDALVYESVPTTRCAPSYMRRRAYSGGQAYAAAVSNAADRPATTRWSIRLKALVQAGLMLPMFMLRAAQGRAALLDHGYAFAGVLGKLSFGGIHPLYAKVDAARRVTP